MVSIEKTKRKLGRRIRRFKKISDLKDVKEVLVLILEDLPQLITDCVAMVLILLQPRER